MGSVKFRDFQGVAYCTFESLCARLSDLRSSGAVSEFACILHDADKDDAGLPKPIHCHFGVRYKSYRSPESVRKDFLLLDAFPGEKNAHVLLQWLVNVNGNTQRIDLFVTNRYFLHLDNPEKVQYSPDCVAKSIGWDDLTACSCLRSKDADTSVEILEKMLSGVSPYFLAREYGKAFIYHYRQFVEIRDAILFTDYCDNDDLNSLKGGAVDD